MAAIGKQGIEAQACHIDRRKIAPAGVQGPFAAGGWPKKPVKKFFLTMSFCALPVRPDVGDPADQRSI
jgi:hypothetical protein